MIKATGYEFMERDNSRQEIRKIICALISISVFSHGIGIGDASAQEKKGGIMKTIHSYTDRVNRITDVIETMRTGPSEFDDETKAIIRSLKDPFIPQFPKAKTKPKAKPITKPKPKSTAKSKTRTKTKTRPAIKTAPKPIPRKIPAPVKPPQFTTSGMIWNTDRPQAILNGKVVNIGDTIENWTIIAISKKGVEVTYQNKTFIVEP